MYKTKSWESFKNPQKGPNRSEVGSKYFILRKDNPRNSYYVISR